MLRAATLVTLLLTATSAGAELPAYQKSWGVGLMLGSPLGVTAKYRPGGPNAFDLGFGGGPGLRIHGDYLFGLGHVRAPDLTLDFYLGIGPALGIDAGYCTPGWAKRYFCDGGPFFGVRVPAGIEVRVPPAPVTFGIEIAPGIWAFDFVALLIDAFLFVRFEI